MLWGIRWIEVLTSNFEWNLPLAFMWQNPQHNMGVPKEKKLLISSNFRQNSYCFCRIGNIYFAPQTEWNAPEHGICLGTFWYMCIEASLPKIKSVGRISVRGVFINWNDGMGKRPGMGIAQNYIAKKKFKMKLEIWGIWFATSNVTTRAARSSTGRLPRNELFLESQSEKWSLWPTILNCGGLKKLKHYTFT